MSTQELYKHRVQHLRGTAEEWRDHGNVIPLAGELVIEFDNSGNNLHRLKIGDGITPYSQLPYLSVDNFLMAKKYYIKILGTNTSGAIWQQDGDDRYYQVVQPYYIQSGESISANITACSQIDLQPNAEQLVAFKQKELTFVVENWRINEDQREVRFYCIGEIPENDYIIQATITEVVLNG